MISDPWFYALAIPAVLLLGMSKGGFAGGLGILGVPIMSLTISPIQVAGILLPILIVMDMIGFWAYRKTFHKENLLIVLPGAIIGILLGFITAAYVTDDFVRVLVGVIAVGFALDHWIAKRADAAPTSVNRTKGSFWGTVSGFTSFVVHAGGTPLQVYMLPQKLDKRIYVGTSVMFFAIVNLVKVPPYAFLGQLDAANLTTSLVLLPLAPIGMILGIKALNLIPERPFYVVTYIALFVAGCKLLWDGVAGMLA
ncbi:MAG: sulfite exporter TauE/SafE family protein [Parvibaculum sp.]